MAIGGNAHVLGAGIAYPLGDGDQEIFVNDEILLEEQTFSVVPRQGHRIVGR